MLISYVYFNLFLVVVEESVPPMLVDLESLTISDLKQLLNQRGIKSTSTKHDLIGAVNISGLCYENKRYVRF